MATFFWTHRFQAAPGLQHDEIFKANFATYILKGEFPAFFDAAGRALGRGYTSPSGGKRKANERDYALSVFLADEEGNRFGELRRQPLDGDYHQPLEGRGDREISPLGSGFRYGNGGPFWDMTWRARPYVKYPEGKQEESYTVFTRLLDEGGQLWGQKDNPPQGGKYPTTGWLEGEVVRDEYEIPVSPDAPFGSYLLGVGMYQAETGARLPAFDEEGNRLEGDRVILATIQIEE